MPDSCFVPELSSGRRGFLSSKSDSSAVQGLFLPDLHKEEFVNAAKDLSSSTSFLKRQVNKYAFVPQDAASYLCPKRVSPKLVAVASRLGKKFGTRGPFDKSDNLLFDLSFLFRTIGGSFSPMRSMISVDHRRHLQSVMNKHTLYFL